MPANVFLLKKLTNRPNAIGIVEPSVVKSVTIRGLGNAPYPRLPSVGAALEFLAARSLISARIGIVEFHEGRTP